MFSATMAAMGLSGFRTWIKTNGSPESTRPADRRFTGPEWSRGKPQAGIGLVLKGRFQGIILSLAG
jgi:hypothetical protein